MSRRFRPPVGLAFAAVALAACGGTSSSSSVGTNPRAKAHTAPAVAQSLESVSVTTAGMLPKAVQDAAAAPLADGRLVLLGGIDDSGGSTASIQTVGNSSSGAPGSLPVPQHDAQAATLGAAVYVFGGGQVSSYDHILRYDPSTGAVSRAGTLPTPASDVAVAPVGETAYVVGGYTGTEPLDTIVAWSPGGSPQTIGHLPAGLRYAAVSAAGSRLIIAGGTVAGAPSDAILAFDTKTGTLRQIGRLPFPLTHASAATLAGDVLVVGGRRELSGGQTDAVLAIDPSTGAVRTVGHLPHPLSDASVAAVANRILVAGGDGGNGPESAILALAPRLGGGA